MRDALVRSKNVPTVRLADAVGLERRSPRLAQRGGHRRADRAESPSMALGTVAVSPLELTAAYTAFASLGQAVEPRLILRVEDENGQGALALAAAPARGPRPRRGLPDHRRARRVRCARHRQPGPADGPQGAGRRQDRHHQRRRRRLVRGLHAGDRRRASGSASTSPGRSWKAPRADGSRRRSGGGCWPASTRGGRRPSPGPVRRTWSRTGRSGDRADRRRRVRAPARLRPRRAVPQGQGAGGLLPRPGRRRRANGFPTQRLLAQREEEARQTRPSSWPRPARRGAAARGRASGPRRSGRRRSRSQDRLAEKRSGSKEEEREQARLAEQRQREQKEKARGRGRGEDAKRPRGEARRARGPRGAARPAEEAGRPPRAGDRRPGEGGQGRSDGDREGGADRPRLEEERRAREAERSERRDRQERARREESRASRPNEEPATAQGGGEQESAPAAEDLSGWWELTNTIQSTNYSAYKGLRLGYRASARAGRRPDHRPGPEVVGGRPHPARRARGRRSPSPDGSTAARSSSSSPSGGPSARRPAVSPGLSARTATPCAATSGAPPRIPAAARWRGGCGRPSSPRPSSPAPSPLPHREKREKTPSILGRRSPLPVREGG